MPMSPNQYEQWRNHWAELNSNAFRTPNPHAEEEFIGMFYGIVVGIIIGVIAGIFTT